MRLEFVITSPEWFMSVVAIAFCIIAFARLGSSVLDVIKWKTEKRLKTAQAVNALSDARR